MHDLKDNRQEPIYLPAGYVGKPGQPAYLDTRPRNELSTFYEDLGIEIPNEHVHESISNWCAQIPVLLSPGDDDVVAHCPSECDVTIHGRDLGDKTAELVIAEGEGPDQREVQHLHVNPSHNAGHDDQIALKVAAGILMPGHEYLLDFKRYDRVQSVGLFKVTVGDRISPTVTPTTRTPITSTPTPRTPTPTRTVGVFCMYFDSGCSDLAKQSLDRGTPTIEGCEPLAAGPMLEADKPKLLAHLLASRPGGISLRIDGYCDSAGAPDMNKYLGCLRADRVRDAVRKELTKLGMTPTHICTVSHGKEGARGGALWNDRRVSITLDDTCEAECLREWDKTPTPRPPVCQHPPRGKRPARPP